MSQKKFLTPIALIEHKLHMSKLNLSRYLKVDESTVHRWHKNCRINPKYLPILLKLVKEYKSDITAEHLINGAFVKAD